MVRLSQRLVSYKNAVWTIEKALEIAIPLPKHPIKDEFAKIDDSDSEDRGKSYAEAFRKYRAERKDVISRRRKALRQALNATEL